MVNFYYGCNMRIGQFNNRVDMPLIELKALCIEHDLPLFRLSINKRKFYDEEEWEKLKKPYIRHFTIYEGVEFYNNELKDPKKKKDPKYPELYEAMTDQEKNLEKSALKKIKKKNPQSEDKEPRELEPNIDDAEWRV